MVPDNVTQMADRGARLSNKLFTPPQEETTLTKYSSSLCRLLLFLLRVHAKAESEGAYKLLLGEGAVRLVEGLGSTLHEAVSGPNNMPPGINPLFRDFTLRK
jgi:hypothetical protein